MVDSPPSREVEEFDIIEIQQQSSFNFEHANANGCNKAYAFIRKLGIGLQSLVALLFSNISKAIFLLAGHVENGLETEHLMGQKAYGSILKLLAVLAIFFNGVITVLAHGTRLHCVHWWIPFSLVLIVSIVVAIATSCQLKKMSRSSRQMVSSVAVLGGLCATSTIILISCRVLLCQS